MAPTTNRKPRLLVVDDDPSMIRLLTTILNKEFGDDLTIVALEDPNEALRWAEFNVVDILITDLEMPQLNGMDLLAAVKRRNACTQVFFLTGHTSLGALVDALELGATDYLLKPLDRKVLVEIINDARKRLRRWQEALGGTLAAHQAASQAAVSQP